MPSKNSLASVQPQQPEKKAILPKSKPLTGKTQAASTDEGRVVTVIREPARRNKAFYLQDKYIEAFENLVFAQKKSKGKKAPALAEEAIQMLCDKYGVKV